MINEEQFAVLQSQGNKSPEDNTKVKVQQQAKAYKSISSCGDYRSDKENRQSSLNNRKTSGFDQQFLQKLPVTPKPLNSRSLTKMTNQKSARKKSSERIIGIKEPKNKDYLTLPVLYQKQIQVEKLVQECDEEDWEVYEES